MDFATVLRNDLNSTNNISLSSERRISFAWTDWVGFHSDLNFWRKGKSTMFIFFSIPVYVHICLWCIKKRLDCLFQTQSPIADTDELESHSDFLTSGITVSIARFSQSFMRFDTCSSNLIPRNKWDKISNDKWIRW